MTQPVLPVGFGLSAQTFSSPAAVTRAGTNPNSGPFQQLLDDAAARFADNRNARLVHDPNVQLAPGSPRGISDTANRRDSLAAWMLQI